MNQNNESSKCLTLSMSTKISTFCDDFDTITNDIIVNLENILNTRVMKASNVNQLCIQLVDMLKLVNETGEFFGLQQSGEDESELDVKGDLKEFDSTIKREQSYFFDSVPERK